MKRLVIVAGILAVLSLAGGAQAQTGIARGRVVNEKGDPVPDAKIEIEFQGGMSRRFETKTSKKGEFTQVGLHPGVYRITATKEGHQGTYIEGKIGLGEPTYLPDLKLVSQAAAKAAAAPDKELQAVQEAVDKAIAASNAGRHDEAVALYQEAIAKKPDIPALHHNMGVVLSKKKDVPGAEAAFQKALALNPDYGEAHVGLSNLYLATNQIGKAAEAIAKSAAEHPDDPRIQFQLGYVNFNAGKPEEAAVAFKKTAELEPDNAEVHFFLGSIAIGQAEVEECASELEKYLAAAPKDAPNVPVAQQLLAACKPKQ